MSEDEESNDLDYLDGDAGGKRDARTRELHCVAHDDAGGIGVHPVFVLDAEKQRNIAVSNLVVRSDLVDIECLLLCELSVT